MSTYMYDRDMDKEINELWAMAEQQKKRADELSELIRRQDNIVHQLVSQMIDAGLSNSLLTHPSEYVRGVAQYHRLKEKANG